jgi:SEC-C motif domain protein
MTASQPCPCGRKGQGGAALDFDRCCGRWLEGTPAPDPEALMRSRYSAFVLGDEAYLLATWHPRTRPLRVDFDAGTKWLGLDVRDAPPAQGGQAEVEFVARYRIGGRAVRLHERSRFERLDDGRWYYVDGEVR